MWLLLCDGAAYTAKELDFLVHIGWVPIDVLIKCSLSWLT
jgi:hypothetical protein